jgi:hypothetical protein
LAKSTAATETALSGLAFGLLKMSRMEENERSGIFIVL